MFGVDAYGLWINYGNERNCCWEILTRPKKKIKKMLLNVIFGTYV